MTHDSNILIARTQFPFGLAYALTFNKAQGQTLSRVLVDLSNNRGSAAVAGDKYLHGKARCSGVRVVRGDGGKLGESRVQ